MPSRRRFSTNRLSLLDRGLAYAIAHIRGGDDLGYQWFLDGKLEKRTNTFNDFVDVAKGLIARGLHAARAASRIKGGSAGGELMGAVVNSDPELWGAVVADVPFVDVLNTMLDDTLPLTPGEWPEWGNPITDKAAFELIRSYSPYDNVKAQAYPPMLITGGLNDPRVTYWEPAKWAAKLRADQDRRQSAAAQDQHGRGPRRQVGPLGAAARGRGDLCLRPDAGRRMRLVLAALLALSAWPAFAAPPPNPVDVTVTRTGETFTAEFTFPVRQRGVGFLPLIAGGDGSKVVAAAELAGSDARRFAAAPRQVRCLRRVQRPAGSAQGPRARGALHRPSGRGLCPGAPSRRQ